MIRKKISEITREDIENILVWDREGDELSPFFFDPNQETLVPLYHDVIPADLYVRAKLIYQNHEYLSIARYSNDIFYQNNDFEALDIWFWDKGLQRLLPSKKPSRLSINLKTYPYFNDYLIFSFEKSDLEMIGVLFLKVFTELVDLKGYLNVLFTGVWGSGKTTLISSFIKTNSPSFAIMNSTKIGKYTFNHWDLYRIEPTQENLKTIDFWEYLSSDKTINLIEWANKVKLENFINNAENIICINLIPYNHENSRIAVVSSIPEFIEKLVQHYILLLRNLKNFE
ncbi:MAG: tRNA (adenosine(37)-N6)-threonylcarbamoyltransferase complex ATPase subunit type 1 TsaE [bacterium]